MLYLFIIISKLGYNKCIMLHTASFNTLTYNYKVLFKLLYYIYFTASVNRLVLVTTLASKKPIIFKYYTF